MLGADVPQGTRTEHACITAALAAPIAAPALHEAARGARQVSVLVSDKTRKCRTEIFLPYLLDELRRAGIADDGIRIVFATGTHPPQSEAERRAIVGDAVYERYRVLEHNARDSASCVHCGTTRFGTPVLLNRVVAASDFVVAAGTIVHHYFAGFGGGAKLFVPGVAAYDTAVRNHRRTITDEGRFHPACRDGNVDGNPVMEDIQDAVRFFPPSWYFAALLDAHGVIADAVAGDLREAHRVGAARVHAMYSVPIARRADVCIASAGGFPKDINFIQAHKSIHHAHYATRPGGTLICLAECREGLGNEDLARWFAIQDDEEFRRSLRHEYAMNAHTALAVREKGAAMRVILVSSLPEALVRSMRMEPAASLDAAIAMAAGALPDGAHAYVMEQASLFVPEPRA